MKPGIKSLIAGLAFFAVCITLLILTPKPLFFARQEEQIRGDAEFGALFANLAFIQEIRAKKDYVEGVELLLGNWKRSEVKCQYIILVLDSSNNLIHRENFFNTDIALPNYYLFRFHKEAFIGKGKRFYLCLYSPDASPKNNIALGRRPAGRLGELYVSPVVNDDILAAVAKKGGAIGGSFCVKTYESDGNGISGFKLLLVFLSILLSLSVIYQEKALAWLLKHRISPAWVFLALALSGGIAMTFITPPFQVPDERNHFYRCYQVTELNILQTDKTVPRSLTDVADRLSSIGFVPYYKTSFKEIRELATIRLDPGDRKAVSAPEYTLPYLPQAIGMAVGRLLHASPLALLYYGRMANLMISILLIFMAIRITPVLKWVFFLLGLMPMMLFQLASVSYDATTNSLSLLVAAFILNCAFVPEKRTGWKELLLIFMLSFLLALCKPPYYVLAAMFLVIPYRRVGSMLRFSLTFLLLLALIYAGTRLVSFRGWSQPEQVTTAAAPPAPGNPATPENPATPATDVPVPGAADQGSDFNAPGQIAFILHNPVQYGKILLNTFRVAGKVYTDYFFGVLGWADTPLPGYLRTFFLLTLLITSIVLAEPVISINWYSKIYFFLLFLAGILLIETGLYLYCNPVGNPIVLAVQGRYFIVFTPLLFLVFYNRHTSGIITRVFSVKQNSPPSGNSGKVAIKARVTGISRFPVFYEVILIGLAVFTLSVTLYTLLTRYYPI